MTEVVTVYHIYPEGCCDDYKYTVSNELLDGGTQGIEILYQEKSSETKKYEIRDRISLDLQDAIVLYKLLGKLITKEA